MQQCFIICFGKNISLNAAYIWPPAATGTPTLNRIRKLTAASSVVSSNHGSNHCLQKYSLNVKYEKRENPYKPAEPKSS